VERRGVAPGPLAQVEHAPAHHDRASAGQQLLGVLDRRAVPPGRPPSRNIQSWSPSPPSPMTFSVETFGPALKPSSETD
jgi:hypothetical protein